MIDNPFEFGIIQRVRRWFAGDPNDRKLIDEACANVQTASRAALIAVIEKWGPITFAHETIEANKEKQIQITRENGFVNFRIGAPNDQRTNGIAAGVQRFSGDAGESGDGETGAGLQTDARQGAPCQPGRVWCDHVYTESDLPRD